MYVDTDVVLALLKQDDWLTPTVESADLESPKRSVVTAMEVRLVTFETWSRDRLATVCEEIAAEGVERLALTPETFDAGAQLLPAYESLNVFDAVHLGNARALDEPIVSTDTLYPRIEQVEHLDPRDL
jgi:hypothetical protein